MDRAIPKSIRPSFERTKHPFYMWDELMKTPDALQTVLTPAVSEQIRLAAAKIREVDVVHLVGCGTSYFSSIAGTYALQRIAGVRAQAHNAFEFSAYPPPRLDTSALVAISHTGGTAVPEVVSPLYGTIPIYEFTYELALARGIRPDVMRLTDDRFLDARLKLPR